MFNLYKITNIEDIKYKSVIINITALKFIIDLALLFPNLNSIPPSSNIESNIIRDVNTTINSETDSIDHINKELIYTDKKMDIEFNTNITFNIFEFDLKLFSIL